MDKEIKVYVTSDVYNGIYEVCDERYIDQEVRDLIVNMCIKNLEKESDYSDAPNEVQDKMFLDYVKDILATASYKVIQ